MKGGDPMFTDPLSVTYNGSAKSLTRVSVSGGNTLYRTSDGEFEVSISHSPTADGLIRHEITLTRIAPDPTPADVFDNYSRLPNRFEMAFATNSYRAGSATDLPLLRTALQALVDSSFQTRLVGGEA